MIGELAPEIDALRAGQRWAPHGCRILRSVIRLGKADAPRACSASTRSRNWSSGPTFGGSRRSPASLIRHDPINIQFTSGTTGAPKGATLTHRNIVNNGFFVGEAMRLTEQTTASAFRCRSITASAWCMGNLACITHGAAMVYPAPKASIRWPRSRRWQTERCTALYGVPTMFIAELDHPDFERFDLSSLRTGIMAGAPCPIEVMKRVHHTHAHDAR